VPLYEYECLKCRRRFEKIESVSAAVIKKCPECGGRAKRLPAAPAIQFKGSGWYVTDYGGKNSGASASSEKAEGQGAASSSDHGGEKASKKSPAEKDSSKKEKKD
jgi:putative FmdB family regulatory protein